MKKDTKMELHSSYRSFESVTPDKLKSENASNFQNKENTSSITEAVFNTINSESVSTETIDELVMLFKNLSIQQ